MCAVKPERQAFTSPTTLRAKVSFLQAIERSSSHVRNPCPQMMSSRNTQAADDSLDGVWHPLHVQWGPSPGASAVLKDHVHFLAQRMGQSIKLKIKLPFFKRMIKNLI